MLPFKHSNRFATLMRGSFRLWLLLAFGASCLTVGFALPISLAYQGVREAGVVFVMALLVGWLCSLVLLLKRRFMLDGLGARTDWFFGAVLIALTILTWNFLAEPRFGVMDDEGTLANTALSIYETGEVFSAHRGYWLGDDFEIVDGRMDKRPWLFPAIVAMYHWIFGYDVGNAFKVNYWISLFAVLTFWFLLKQFFRPLIALVAILPFIWNPVWLQSVCGAGLEPVNYLLIAMLGCTMFFCGEEKYGQAPETLAVFCASLLAYARYESAVWVVVLGVFLVLKAGRLTEFRPGLAIFMVSFLLIPSIWLLRLTLARTDGFQGAGTEELPVFSLDYLREHLVDNSLFFLNPSWSSPNDLFLLLVGASGLVWAVYAYYQSQENVDRFPECRIAVVTWLSGFVIMYCIYATYFWGSFQDALAVRFSLVVIPPLLAGWGFFLNELTKRLHCDISILFFVCLFYALCSLPNVLSLKEVPKRNPHAASQNWKLDWLQTEQLEPKTTFFIDNHPHVWNAARYPSITCNKLVARLKPLSYQMKRGGFKNVFLVETLRLNASGEWRPVLSQHHDYFQLEPVEDAYYQLTPSLRTQISRVLHIKDHQRTMDDFDDLPYDPLYLP
ncbi:hypothetical protein QEH59_07765 [Coraliomargarita sp. SDUM461004]|uniref:Glycosyltransferase RgtA/B/C/D-like domain-containing protein n=1 Tax=Thalassobacterium sedimentorum TaxID=3041258 RepID=A0ABU1AHZ9_9BACT|nr:hypothetical protein [Coraliomargarita sp. SDUM461004]MDQ8194317.1 hypothetical protein [Coraliomargarita sp. SDUM461004]